MNKVDETPESLADPGNPGTPESQEPRTPKNPGHRRPRRAARNPRDGTQQSQPAPRTSRPSADPPAGLSRRQALTVFGVGAGRADRRTGPRRRRDLPDRQRPAAAGGPAPPRAQRLRPRRHRGPRRRAPPERRPAARQPVPPEPGQEHHVPAVPRPRTDAPLVPPQLRRAVSRRAARRLGEAGLADPRPHDRPPAVRPRADLRQHRRRGRQDPRPLPGQPARRAPGPGSEAGFPPRLPVRVPRGLLRHPGAGQVDLVAVLHDPQVPGRDDRPVPADGRRPGARRGRRSWPTGWTGGRAPEALVRPDADGPADRVRRAAGGAGQPVHDHRPGAVPGHRAALLPRRSPRPAGRRDGQPARPAGERDHAEDHRLRPDVGGDRQRQVPRHRAGTSGTS